LLPLHGVQMRRYAPQIAVSSASKANSPTGQASSSTVAASAPRSRLARGQQEVRQGQSLSYAARPGRHGVKREHETRQQDRRRPSAWPASACVPAARSPDQASGLAVMKSAAASHSAQPPVACRTAPLRARSMPRTEATRAQSSSPACPARWLPRRLG
jgi:hypothetical protein